MKKKQITRTLRDANQMFQALGQMANIALHPEADEVVTYNYSKLEKRSKYRDKCRFAATRKNAHTEDTANGVKILVDKDKNQRWKKGCSVDTYREDLDKIDQMEVTFDIAVMDAALLSKGMERPKAAVKVACEWMFENADWVDDDELALPDDLKAFAGDLPKNGSKKKAEA